MISRCSRSGTLKIFNPRRWRGFSGVASAPAGLRFLVDMTIRTVLLVFLSALAALFAVVNWQAIMAVVPVNLLFTQINAPLGLIIIVGFGALWLFVLVWAIMQQASVVFELRRAYKEVHANKTLAENAEKSRLQEARTALEDAVKRVEEKMIERADTAAQAQSERAAALKSGLEGLVSEVKLLRAQVETIAQKAEITVPEELPQEPAEPEKKGFFGLFGGKKEEPEAAAPAPAPAEEKPAQAEAARQ